MLWVLYDTQILLQKIKCSPLCFLSLVSGYFPQHFVYKHLYFILFPFQVETKPTNIWDNYGIVIIGGFI